MNAGLKFEILLYGSGLLLVGLLAFRLCIGPTNGNLVFVTGLLFGQLSILVPGLCKDIHRYYKMRKNNGEQYTIGNN